MKRSYMSLKVIALCVSLVIMRFKESTTTTAETSANVTSVFVFDHTVNRSCYVKEKQVLSRSQEVFTYVLISYELEYTDLLQTPCIQITDASGSDVAKYANVDKTQPNKLLAEYARVIPEAQSEVKVTFVAYVTNCVSCELYCSGLGSTGDSTSYIDECEINDNLMTTFNSTLTEPEIDLMNIPTNNRFTEHAMIYTETDFDIVTANGSPTTPPSHQTIIWAFTVTFLSSLSTILTCLLCCKYRKVKIGGKNTPYNGGLESPVDDVESVLCQSDTDYSQLYAVLLRPPATYAVLRPDSSSDRDTNSHQHTDGDTERDTDTHGHSEGETETHQYRGEDANLHENRERHTTTNRHETESVRLREVEPESQYEEIPY